MLENEKPFVVKIEGEDFEKLKKLIEEDQKVIDGLLVQAQRVAEQAELARKKYWDNIYNVSNISETDQKKNLTLNTKYEDAGFYLVEEKCGCGLDGFLKEVIDDMFKSKKEAA